MVHHNLTIGPGIIGGTGHGIKVALSLVGLYGRAGQLPVRQIKVQLFDILVHFTQEIVTDLIAESPGSRVNQQGDLPLLESHDPGQPGIVHPVHHPDLEEVIA